MFRKKWFRRVFWCLLLLFLVGNFIAYMHAYKMTHFTNEPVERTSTEISGVEKLEILFTGIKNPRPVNHEFPAGKYETHFIKSRNLLEAWLIQTLKAKGTFILFHGYAGKKSDMLERSEQLIALGYNVMLVDFSGSGGSQGNSTSIGFHEATEVKDAYQYLVEKGFKNISLYGTSMGAVAIMKAVKDFKMQPSSIIVEYPYGTMYKTVKARFKMNGLPAFPMAGLLVFWGGIQNNFWAFSHNPESYAKEISCPTLLLYGEKDERVSRKEIDKMYENLKGPKTLRTYQFAGHESFLQVYHAQWLKDIREFLFINNL